MIDSEEQARAFCAALCDEAGMARLDRFAALLAEENERQNLVSDASLNKVWQRHIADSLQLLVHSGEQPGTWLDLGTGAGMPGLLIAIARPDIVMHCVESRKKRVEWLESVCSDFGLANCHIHGARLEHVEAFECRVISARAFAPMEKLLRLSARFSTQATTWVLPKGRSAAQELSKQSPKLQSMFHVEQSRTDPQAGIIIGKGVPSLP